MLTKTELKGEIQNIMRTLGTITFETSVVQNDMHELMLGVLTEEIGDGGILRHRLAHHEYQLELALSHFKNLISKFKIEEKQCETS
jgi:hypothetical protein